MKKKVMLMGIISFLSLSSFAQTIRENIDKQEKDPKRIENAAKADVYLHDKTIISDSLQKEQRVIISNKKKKKNCGRKKAGK
jgi:hypothetical protein